MEAVKGAPLKLLDRSELLKIAASLEDYHKVFYTFWEMSAIYFTEQIPTAAVRFDLAGGKPQLMFNEKFWNKHDHRGKLFIVCHECMHVLLDHGVRDGMSVKGATPELVNKAQDITINHMIVDLFNYDREDLLDWKNYCWIETCFTNPVTIKRNETFIYYLEKLIEDPKSAETGGPVTLDAHSDPSGGKPGSDPASGGAEAEKKAREAAAGDLAKDLDPKDLEGILKALPQAADGQAGTMAGVYEALINLKTKKLKLNFHTIIKKLKRTQVKYVEKDVDSFVRESRRFEDVLQRRDVSLPGSHQVQGPLKDRLLTVLFMDVSGSCMQHFPKFEKIAAAFDAEREIFDLRAFAFDTSCHEIMPNVSLKIGGGTNFGILEQEVLKLEKEYHRYPDCVVVVTDGEGTSVSPKIPSRWIWLLTPPGVKQYVPTSSRAFQISQIEI